VSSRRILLLGAQPDVLSPDLQILFWESDEKLTKQAGTFYHLYALFGGGCMFFVGAKILHHISPRGYSV
jgi:hypothetical protein